MDLDNNKNPRDLGEVLGKTMRKDVQSVAVFSKLFLCL